jgi:N6-adenosine-specific RNA methylase IME4/DNA modification methylase
VPKPQTTTTDEWLADFGDRIARANAAIAKLDRKKVALDIQARTLERGAARDYARNRPELWKRLAEIGRAEHEWCKAQGRGNSLSQWRRRLKLLNPGAFRRYLYHRRERGDDNVFGLEYAIALSKLPIPGEDESETSARPPPRVQNADGTLDPEKVALITGDGVEEMCKEPAGSVNVIIKSFPYWPAQRVYSADGKPGGYGFEPTWEEFCDNQVRKVGREEKRVLRGDGVLWVVMDDSIAEPARERTTQSDNGETVTFRVQDSTYLRQKGNWLLLPFRYAMAMQDDGWHLRDIIIIDKGSHGRKESSPSRTRHSHEYLFMFTKSAAGYCYDQDEVRVPPAEISATSLIFDGSYRKPGVIRGDRLNFHAVGNPLGRVAGSVWFLPPHYVGDHPATFHPEMVRRCLALTCPPGGHVLDPVGGAGTVAVVASQMGFKVTSIDLNLHYTEEARQRVLTAHAQLVRPNYKVNGPDIRPAIAQEIADGARYRGILADVPWHAWPTFGKPGAADRHYAVMELQEILDLRVREVATDDATLFLWVPHSMLEEAPWVMRAWGFESARTGMVWDKITGFGNGFSFRMQHEHLLVGRAPRAPRHFKDHSISSVLHAPRGLHSEKPPEVHGIIERALGGKGPFLELFGRRHVPGWKVLGNQLPPPDELAAAAD